MKKIYLIFCLGLLYFSSCHKDDFNITKEETSLFTAKVYNEITASAIGYVYDENKNPIAGAKVEIYSASTTTDEHGVFEFKNVKMDEQGTYLRVTKSGYIMGSDRLYPNKAKVFSYIKMFSDKQDKSFNSQTGGTIALTGGGTIVFPSNAIRLESGEAYQGEVRLTAQFIDPTSKTLGDEMPGGLIGVQKNGSTVSLGTAGMFVVEMKSPEGANLNLIDGKKAQFTIPAKSNGKPANIALWSFDENEGTWKEEGIAKLVGQNYIGEVSHFSFWNCDAPFPLIHVCGTVVDQKGNPIPNAQVQVNAAVTEPFTYLTTAWGYTDMNGEFCGKMPKGVPLTIQVNVFGCNGLATTINVGPFDTDQVLNPIVINLGESNVNCEIVCNGTPVIEGYIIVSQENETAILPFENGELSFDVTQIFCDATKPITFTAVNTADNKSSSPVLYTASNEDYLFELCNLNCDLNGSFTGVCGPELTINVAGGSGNYTYLWDNGETTPFLTINNVGQRYVTVTDINLPGCVQTFSTNILPNPIVEIFQQSCVNPVTLTIESNNQNKILWSTGDTIRTINVNPTVETTYSVTVTNVNGCTGTASTTVNPSNAVYINETPISCNKNLFTLDGSFTGGSIYAGGLNLPLTSPLDIVNLDIFQTGFNFGGFIYSQGCQKEFWVNLPEFSGLEITNATAIDTMQNNLTIIGNSINYTTVGTCTNCTEGAVEIYNVNDLSTNLVTLNPTGLPPGQYYVIVPDAITGCYVAFRKVTIL